MALAYLQAPRALLEGVHRRECCRLEPRHLSDGLEFPGVEHGRGDLDLTGVLGLRGKVHGEP